MATPTSNISVVGVNATGILRGSENTLQTVRMCTPTLQEIFYPDLTFTATTITSTNPHNNSQREVFLPYLANDGLIPVAARQTKRYNCEPTDCSA